MQSTAPTPGHMPHSFYRPGDNLANTIMDNQRVQPRPPGKSALEDDDLAYGRGEVDKDGNDLDR